MYISPYQESRHCLCCCEHKICFAHRPSRTPKTLHQLCITLNYTRPCMCCFRLHHQTNGVQNHKQTDGSQDWRLL